MKSEGYVAIVIILAITNAAQATLTYNDGLEHDIGTPQSDASGSVPVLAISGDTTVRWNSDALLLVATTASANTAGMIRVEDTSAYHLDGGSIVATQTVSGRLSALYLVNYAGLCTLTSGSLLNTRTVAGDTAAAGTMRTFESQGSSQGQVDVSGGTYTTSESFAGDTELVRAFAGCSTVFNFSGGTFNLTEGGGGVLTLCRLQGATVNISGGSYHLSSDGDIRLFSLENTAASLNLSGGTITANQNLTGAVTDGRLILNGTFTNGVMGLLTNGVYTTAHWVDASVTGTLTNGGVLNLSSLNLAGAGTITINGDAPAPPPPPPPPPPPTNNLPNVIFVMVDDMGYSDLGCYGGEIETPHLDRLASEGLRFRQFYNNAKCETTRSALMSGLDHRTAGLTVGNGTTLGAAMRSAGYRTYAVGKWHLGTSSSQVPVARGFDIHFGFYGGGTDYFSPKGNDNTQIRLDCLTPDDFVSSFDTSYFDYTSSTRALMNRAPADYYSTDAFGDNAVAFIDDALTHHADRPFFIYLAFNAPHTPAMAPESVIQKYRPIASAGWEVARQQRSERQKALGIVDPEWPLPNWTDDIPRWKDLTQAEQYYDIEKRAAYCAQVDVVDQNVGKILARLDELNATARPGILSNTIIMFCSDNGCQGHGAGESEQRAGWATVSNTPFRYYKQSQHQGGICSPLIVRWPGTVATNRITDEPTHVTDIMATLVDLAGIQYNALTTPGGNPVSPLYGSSLRPVFNGGTRTHEPSWYFELNHAQMGYLKGDWKIVSENSGPWRLFNLHNDRTETRNLRWLHPEIVQELEQLYDAGNPNRKYADRDQRIPFVESGLAQDQRYWNPTWGMRPYGVGLTLADIGTVAASSANDEDEYYRISSASTGVGGTADNLTYLCKSFFGDGNLTGYLDTEMGNAVPSSRTGIMLRESVAAGSPFVMTGWNPGGGIYAQFRDASNGAVTTVTGAAEVQPPVFLRVRRAGNVFTSSYSADLVEWTDFHSVTNQMSARMHGGIVVTSGSTGTSTLFRWRDWVHEDSDEYPQRPRLVDGLPELLGYALGADQSTHAGNRLPRLQMTNLLSSLYPELTYIRRKETNGLAFGYLGGGQPGVLMDDTANWVEIGTAPGPEPHSERVTVRRLIDAQAATNGYFRLKVGCY